MQIVGGRQVIASDSSFENLIRFYEGLFDRLKKEVKNTGDLTRYIGYQNILSGKDNLHFLGIEEMGDGYLFFLNKRPDGPATSLHESQKTLRLAVISTGSVRE